MNIDDHYQHVPDCLLEEMDGEALLFNPNTATTLHLNGPSRVVWELCNGENSLADIIAALQEAYPDQASQIEGDVMTVAKELKESDVIKRVTV